MIKKLIAAALALGSVGAQASLTTLDVWNTGMQPTLSGVQFNVSDNTTVDGAFLALGAHAAHHGVTMPNDGVSTFFAQVGTESDHPGYAKWSFDFIYNTGDCDGCSVVLKIDTDPSTAGNEYGYILTNDTNPDVVLADGTRMDSWYLTYDFLETLTGFNPNVASVTNFDLQLLNGAGEVLGSTDITVSVPEPGSLALVGLALAGLGFARRRRA